jgi:uncharacterized protein (DUF433 family)
MKLPVSFAAQLPPIQVDHAGVLRVGGTRIRLETIINAFKSGSAAEEILLKYPSLSLTDIYAQVIEDLVLLAEYSPAGEWEGQVRYVPS